MATEPSDAQDAWHTLTRLSQLAPAFGNFAPRHGDNPLRIREDLAAVRPEPRAVPTYPLAKRPALLKPSLHVSAPQAAPQGRQAAPHVEHRGDPPRVRRAHGAAARAVSGRDQRRPAGGLVPHDRGVRRKRPALRPDRTVSGRPPPA